MKTVLSAEYPNINLGVELIESYNDNLFSHKIQLAINGRVEHKFTSAFNGIENAIEKFDEIVGMRNNKSVH